MANRVHRGENKRRQVLGDAHVDAASATSDPFAAALQELITEYCWGWLWTRDGLTDRERSLTTLAILAALDRGPELQAHVRGALRNGLTIDEIREALLHVAVYAGVPAGIQAFRHARQALEGVPVESSVSEPGTPRAQAARPSPS